MSEIDVSHAAPSHVRIWALGELHGLTQVAELLPCMVEQVQGLWAVANQHVPALSKGSRLSAAGQAIVQESSAMLQAAVQSFAELCRYAAGLQSNLDGYCCCCL